MRVILADGDPDVRRCLRVFLVNGQLDMHVAGEVAAAVDLWPRIHDARPDLLLLDWGLLGTGVTAELASLRGTYPHLQVVVMSGHPEVRRQALATGADAFVSKADSCEQMVKALRKAGALGRAGSAVDDEIGTTEGIDE